MRRAGLKVVDAYRSISPSTKAVALIVLVVLVANGMYVSGLANNNPISWTTGIAHRVCVLTCGRPAIDPNLGYVTQTLGHEAAMDLLHGHFPWWTYTQGLGQPLAGEMQSGAFFPLTLLFAFSSGLVWFHVCLEMIAGVSTYFLARRLSLPVLVATCAGIVFALNGTYAWVGNSVLNPVAFLPMLILGVEMVLQSAASPKNRGWYITAIALALSLYAGFPEVAYLDALLALGWGIVRFFSVAPEQRGRALRRLGLGVAVGIFLALPILVPFLDYLKVGFIGAHTASADGSLALPHYALAAFFDPYVYGTIFANSNVAAMWDGIGGYFGASVCALALVGLFGAKSRALRIFLGGWVLLAMAGTFNILGLHQMWNLIPIVSRSSFSRYSAPGCELAIAILAAFGLHDFTQSVRAKRLLTTTSAFMALVLLWCVHEARTYNAGQTYATSEIHSLDIAVQVLPFVALFFLLVLAQLGRFRITLPLIAFVVVGESLLLFAVPTTQSPKKVTIDYAPIAFLQKNEGQERFVDFALLYPDWGTYFGLNELSDADLPFPQNFKHFIETDLEPGLRPGNEFVVSGGEPGIIKLEHSVVNHFQQYEGASVKYLLMPVHARLIKGLATRGVTEVFHDAVAAIYEMPHPRPYFSASSSCAVLGTSDNEVTLHCPKASTLLRTELSMPGWTAEVNGKRVPITTVEHVYQEVTVPAGRSTVTYSFFPPHEREALGAGLLGVLFLLGSLVNERRRFIPTRHTTHESLSVDPDPPE
jgi:hypothetical protein